MNTLSILESIRNTFTQSLADLTPALDADVTPGHADKLLRQLTELLRTTVLHAFQQWLQTAERPEPRVQHDGLWYRFKYLRSRTFLTPLGPITLERRLFQTDDSQHSYVPMDAAWGMAGHYAMLPVREAVTSMIGQMTPDGIATVLGKLSLFQIGVTAMRKLASDFGVWLESHPEAVAAVRAAEAVPAGTTVLAISLDGTNVRLRERGSKPGRPATGDAGGATLEPTCFKNAMVGTVSWYGPVPAGATTPERLRTAYVAQMPEAGCVAFRSKFEAEVADAARRLDAGTAKVLVIDGASALWHYAESNPTFAGFERILDYFHAAEHVTQAAHALFGKGTAEATAWAAKYRGRMLESDTGGDAVVRAIDYVRRTRKLSAAAKAAVGKERRFFVNNRDRMRYATFRSKGWPIGSGPVEAAGKVLVKQRLGLSGMFWSRGGGQHVLGIRAALKSGRWEGLWAQYTETPLAA